MKNLMIKSSLLLCTLAVALPSHAGWFGKKNNKVSASIASAPSPQLDQMTVQFNQEAVQKFAELQSMMAQGNYVGAFTGAKQILDQARTQVGLDPKTKGEDIIALPDGVLVAEYNRLGKKLADFTPAVQTVIMNTVQKQRGGVYLDLLNLLKRVELIYIECFQQDLATHGPLLKMDIDKIKQDIEATIAIPIFLQDAKVKAPLLIFDNEVVNSDQNYLFNRELMVYLMNNGKVLGYKTDDIEATVEAEVKSAADLKMASFIHAEGADPIQAPAPDTRRHYAAFEMSSDSRPHCYPVDASGKAYGNYVDDKECLAYYSVHEMSSDSRPHCYPTDSAGKAYGNYVDDTSCNK